LKSKAEAKIDNSLFPRKRDWEAARETVALADEAPIRPPQAAWPAARFIVRSSPRLGKAGEDRRQIDPDARQYMSNGV
jgi:hypothetical protein